MFEDVRAAAASAGRALPAGFAWGAYVYVALDDDHPDDARRRGDEHLAWRYDEPRFTADLSGKYVVAGSRDDCIAGLSRFADSGSTHLVLSLVRRPGEPALEVAEAVAEAVLPGLRTVKAG
jgi:alkanesulfonate monooxygenase SsuD/methylene tetrahydromethanopterin reductase-like flavin-dependent oxidoreductase (luciferase family)